MKLCIVKKILSNEKMDFFSPYVKVIEGDFELQNKSLGPFAKGGEP